MEDAEAKPAIKVPTLLELAIHRRKSPNPSLNSDELHPSGSSLQVQKKPEAGTAIAPSPNTRRKRYKSSKATKTFEEFVKIGSAGGVEPGTTSPPDDVTNTPDETSSLKKTSLNPVTSDPARMSTITGSSGIYGVPDRALQTKSSDQETNRKRNYHIKSIRRGIPEIISTDVRGRTMRLQTRGIEITPYCVCQRNAKKRRKSAWIFSCLVTFLCIICPLSSFSTDVAFYIVCSSHFNETANLLVVAHDRDTHAVTSTFMIYDGFVAPGVSHTPMKVMNPVNHQKPVPLRYKRERSSEGQQAYDSINDKSHYVIRHAKSKRSEPTPASIVTKSTPTNVLPVTSEMTTSSNLDISAPVADATITIKYQATESACNNVSSLLSYMTSSDASIQLEAHRRITSEIFEPVFIIGSFPSLLLCIFARLVVMVTKHDHFLSAYVINMVSMPLQLATGALGVLSASYHMGKNGFTCWKCAIDGNCSSVGALTWMEDEVTISLLVATGAKILDGAAGGCVLFVVLLRVIWRTHGHVSIWWYVARFFLSLACFVFCTTISALMVITPAAFIFRLKMMDTITYFVGKEEVSFVLLVILGMGLTAWAVSFATLIVYLLYRTYVYCRVKEHAAGALEANLL